MTLRAVFALFLLAITTSLFAQDLGRTAAATWQVQKYDLDVTPSQDDRARGIAAKATLILKNVSGKPASTLTLRISSAAEVTAVKINESVADFVKSEEKINASSSLQRTAIRFAPVAADAQLTATVEYKINLKENSAVSSVSPTGVQFLPLSFWYPTPNSWFFARGGDAAPVRLKVNAPVGQMVVAGGSEMSGAFDQKLNGQPFFITGVWEMFTVDRGVAVDKLSDKADIYMPKGTGIDGQKRAGELEALIREARAFSATILGKAPDVPLRIVSARRGAGFNSGGTVIVDEAVFRRSRVDSLTAMNIAEAVAKSWLGNGVAVNGEGYGAISEGLSRYIATQFIESKFGKDVADVERLRQRNAYAAISKRDAPMNIVSPLDDFYFPEVANKGAMTWRILAKRVGQAEFSGIVRSAMQDGRLTVGELRTAFVSQKGLLDYLFDQITDMNLLVGLPQANGAETKMALRNTGGTDATVDVAATTVTGEKMVSSATIKAASYGEISFRSAGKIARVEIDVEKMYPQTDYSDDVQPRASADSDPLLAAKRHFDKQDFANAETTAKTLLRDVPRFDDLRALLGRALLAQNKNIEAEREFRAVLDEKLPTSRSLAWANVGLGEIASRSNQTEVALRFAEAAIMADAEYGASLAARGLRNRLGHVSAADAGVKAFFADFDKGATANRKAEIDALVMPGEVAKFAGGVAGSTEQWQTQIRQIDRIDANTVLVEANMTIKLLNKEVETGTAVYRLTKAGNAWKLSAVEMFEVR